MSVETQLKFIEQGIVYDDLSEEDKQIYEDTFEDENGVGKAILVHNTVATEVTVKDCTFIATTGAKTWDGIDVAAVSIDPNGAHTAKVTFEGTNTVDSAFNGKHQIKYAEDTALVTVVG